MKTLELGGTWELREAGKRKTIPARIPGQVHLDLLRAGEIEDPFYRDNENDLQWIGEAGWEYSRTFEVPEEFLLFERLLLRCEGLDTLATLFLNGKRVARTENMFRTWEFDIKGLLKQGRNSIRVCFDSTIPYIEKKRRAFALPSWEASHEVRGRALVRKEPCNYGWDWGPALVTCGIWRDLAIIGFNTARIEDLHIAQDHEKRGSVGVEVTVSAQRTAKCALISEVSILRDGKVVAEIESSFRGREARASLVVKNPDLWWPSGMGKQPLYLISAVLKTPDGEVLDRIEKRIGLRTLRLIRRKDDWGESFEFEANGIPFFAKGANWIPADTFVRRLTERDYRRLLESAVDANMNMLRVWGGGIYEEEVFYKFCDELGICVWQDFIFACSTYPTFDKEFMDNVKAEAEDNVRRLRHHPSLALWCGNNELEQGMVADRWDERRMSWKDYSKLFDRLLPQVVKRLDPERDYWPSSPHSPTGDRNNFNNPSCGDAHLWDVWHGRKPFEWYRTAMHRFCSEFGFQSFPEPKTVYAYTELSDRNVTSPVMEHHQRSWIGNTAIMTYMLDWFRMPKDFEYTLWLSQILQGLAIKYAVEHWRRLKPRNMGALYWQLNDCWPVASWASIDYRGRWKALHFMAKRFFAPLLISGVEDRETGTVDVFVTSDFQKRLDGTIEWTLMEASGRILDSGSKKVRIAPMKSRKVERLELSKERAKLGDHNLILGLRLVVDGAPVSSNTVTFAKPKHIDLTDPEISAKVAMRRRGATVVRLKAKRPALYVWLELDGVDARFSENFFDLLPNETREILIQPETEMTASEIEKSLRVRSLRDTY